MAREIIRTMHALSRPEYLGALLEEERRLFLVSVDPEEPWEAFKRMRRILRRQRSKADAVVDIFEAPVPLEHHAEVIPLESKRRAG